MFERKPVLTVFLLAVLLTLPWIGISDFYTKGEPREASTVLSIVQDGKWLIPRSYADELGYKPPMMHWLIAGVAQLTGSVKEWTNRLPSALGMIGLTLMTVVLLLKRTSTRIAVTAALILLTAFDMHRYALECRVDMTLTFFMGAAFLGLYRWEERGLKGFPFLTSLLLICATLVKGPVGFVLPAIVFGMFLLLRGYSFQKAFWINLIVVLPSALLLSLWYYLAWKVEGDSFLRIAFAENIGRVLGMTGENLGINYQLGHSAPFWYYLPALFIGFLPWSLLFVPIVLGVKWRPSISRSVRSLKISTWFFRLREMDAFKLYSWVVVLGVIGFYSLSTSKRSVYILPVYPFVAYLLSEVLNKAFDRNPKTHSVPTLILLFLSTLLLGLFGAWYLFGFSEFIQNSGLDVRTQHDLMLVDSAFRKPSVMLLLGWIQLFVVTLFFILRKHWNAHHSKPLGLFLLFISVMVFFEASVFPIYKNGYSSKPFAESIAPKYDFLKEGYVMNDLRYFRNLYGLNFYLGHPFRNFEAEKPKHGYLVLGEKSLQAVRAKYQNEYKLVELERSNPYNELNDEIVVCKIVAL
jgi:4-amino-4-deoxy-L-arabinose transferase-like glycosyltransferase